MKRKGTPSKFADKDVTSTEDQERSKTSGQSVDDMLSLDAFDQTLGKDVYSEFVNSTHRTGDGRAHQDREEYEKDPDEDKSSGRREGEPESLNHHARKQDADALIDEEIRQSITHLTKCAVDRALVVVTEKWAAEAERQRQQWAEQQQAREKRMFEVLQHQIADLKVQVTRPNLWQEAHHQDVHHHPADNRRDSEAVDQNQASSRRESAAAGSEEPRQAGRQQHQDRVRQQEFNRLHYIQNDLRDREDEFELAAGAGAVQTLGSMLSADIIGKAIVQRIPPYNGTNYEVWADEMERVFILDNKLEYLTTNMLEKHGPTSPQGREDLRLASFLESNIDPRFKHLIRKNGNAVSQIWAALREKHQHEIKLKIEDAVLKLTRLAREGPKQSLVTYMDLMMNTVYDLQRRGATVDDFVTAIVLSGIPTSYSYLKAHVRHMDGPCEMKVNLIRRMYEAPAKQINNQQNRAPKVFAVQKDARPKVKNDLKASRTSLHQRESDAEESDEGEQATKFRASKSVAVKQAKTSACFRCGKQGHWKAECQMRGQVFGVCDQCCETDDFTESEDEHDREQINLVVEQEDSDWIDAFDEIVVNQVVVNHVVHAEILKNRWIFDTGSSVHIANDTKWFRSLRPTNVKFGTSSSKSTLRAEGIGQVRFTLSCGREFTVDNVYYCPQARMNLLSNQNLSSEFEFRVTSEKTTAKHVDSRTGRNQKFDFARVEDKQNVILVDEQQRTVMANLRSSGRTVEERMSEPPRPKSTGHRSIETSRERLDEDVAGDLQQPAKRGRGRPRKYPPKDSVAVEPALRGSHRAATPAEQIDDPSARPPAEKPPDPPSTDEESGSEQSQGRRSPCQQQRLVIDRESESEIDEARERDLFPPRLREQMKRLGRNNKVKNSKDVHVQHGHPGQGSTNRMAVLYDVPCKKFNCEPCRIGNLKHEVNRNESVRESTRPLEVVYMDLCQPYGRAVTGYGGAQYSLVILDDFTGYSRVYNLKHKSDTFGCFERYMAWAERRHPNCKIAEIRTDNGKEFDNEKFRELTGRLGIDHRFAVAHIHEMNGKVERLNRTLEEKCYRLMDASGLPLMYWPLGMQHAATLTNNTANTRNGIPHFNFFNNVDSHMPFEFGEKVAYLHYDTKGIKQRGKGRIVGQDLDSKSYKVIPHGSNVVTGRIYFVKRLHRFPDEDAIPYGDREEQEELVFLNDFARKLFESRERDRPVVRDRSNDLERKADEILAGYVMQVAAGTEQAGGRFDVPKRYSDIQNFNPAERIYWYDKVHEELNTLNEKGVIRVVPRADAKSRPIGTQYVFTHKDDVGKARLVARGDRQAEETFDETFSPTMNCEVLRILLKLALEFDWDVNTFDVKRAFLNARLDEDIYIEIPEGYHFIDANLNRQEHVLQLERALYGLKQAGRAWYQEICGTLKKFGFVALKREPTVFVHPDKNIILGLYVDDIVAIGEDQLAIEYVRQMLKSVYEIHDGGEIRRVLGLNIEKKKDCYLLHLRDMIEDLGRQYLVKESDRVFTPLPANIMIEPHSDAEDVDFNEYASLLGSLLYIARMTRPDILSAVVQLCQFQARPKKTHHRRLMMVLSYLVGTKDLGLEIARDGSLELAVYSDSSLANLHDRKSLMGCSVHLGRSLISYLSRKSALVTLSSNEAEIVAGLTAVRELLYFKRLICALRHGRGTGEEPADCKECTAVPMYVDNSGVLSFIEKGFTRRTRYLDLQYFALKGYAESNEYSMEYVKSAENRADSFTKSMPRESLETHREMLGLRPI